MQSNNKDSLVGRQSRTESVRELVPIKTGYLYSGFHADFNIYIRMGQSTTLMCSDVTITDKFIDKLDAAEDSGKILCVSRDSYKKIILNAARIAESRGSELDWDKVRQAADNPPTFEQFAADSHNPKHADLMEHISKSGPRWGIRHKAEDEHTEEHIHGLVSDHGVHHPGGELSPIEEYFAISDDVLKLIRSSMRNYSVKLYLLNDTAERIVKFVRETDADTVLQCMSTLRHEKEYLNSHSQNLACLNALTGAWLNLPHSDRVNLAIVGLLHDLGRQQISRKITEKKNKLTESEFNLLKHHSIHSYNIAVASGITNKDVLSGIRHHHEKLNGTGYPDHLTGDAICLYARVTAISDMYDAMLSKAAHREALSPLDALAEFSELSSTELDLNIVNTLLKTLAATFINKRVLLSNGQTGFIASLNSSDYANPIVQVDREYVKTSRYLKVVSFLDVLPAPKEAS
jgi:HD-GYP domain-containing protein (c-di-GMP phosphodiesterase class II)